MSSGPSRASCVIISLAGIGFAGSVAAADVFMQVAEVPNIDTRFQFLGELMVQGDRPIEAMASGTTGPVTDFAHGRANYTGIGMHARQNTNNGPDRGFTVSSLLRYSDLIFMSDDGANSVSGTLNLHFEGGQFFDSDDFRSSDLSMSVSLWARSNTSAPGGNWFRRVSIFGDNSSSQGLLAGFTGSGSIDIAAPLTFSTVVPEKIEIELQIRISTFSLSPGPLSGVVDGNYLDTLRLNPAHLVSFTSGVNPTFSSATGEIVDNRIVIPGPGALGLLVIGVAAGRRR